MTSYKFMLTVGALSSVGALAASQASAAVSCTVTITQVSIDDSSGVFISASGQASLTQNAVCILTETAGAVKPIVPKACEKMHSQFLAALLSGRSMELVFTGSTCPTFSPWANVFRSTTDQLYYVGLR